MTDESAVHKLQCSGSGIGAGRAVNSRTVYDLGLSAGLDKTDMSRMGVAFLITSC